DDCIGGHPDAKRLRSNSAGSSATVRNGLRVKIGSRTLDLLTTRQSSASRTARRRSLRHCSDDGYKSGYSLQKSKGWNFHPALVTSLVLMWCGEGDLISHIPTGIYRLLILQRTKRDKKAKIE